ncbi:MAG: polyprenyl synthetase family protein [Clostridia bacterium]|nr:polyprenyl synthetase family protein [Clostridia bacterium]
MIDLLIKEYKNKIDTRLDMLLPQSDKQYKSVVDAARYSLLSGGKRIRPIILLEFYKLCGKNDDCAYNFACALEMIHTYSLIHDDLPCMDDDDLRRGKPSCHKKYGEATALLAGDALLTNAFLTASKTMGIDFRYVSESIGYLSACAGIDGMIAGQILDIEDIFKNSLEDTLLMYSLKTGKLLKAAALIGVTLAGGDETQKSAAISYAENLGLAFQIIDDILDTTATEEQLGKTVNSDDKNDKTTVVKRLGIEESKKLADKYTNAALDSLNTFSGDKTTLTELSNYLLNRNS